MISGIPQKKTSTEITTAMPLDPGQIILVCYPFTDHTAGKLRPAVVVSSNRFNQGQDFVALPISSRLDQDDPYSFHIGDDAPYFAGTKLRQASSIKWTKPMTICESVVVRKLGFLPPEVLAEVAGNLKAMFD